ncbi:MAG: hypothetical protein M3R43_02330, partial [Acidobacteriota bacterium]|nr:hypothetical protein [Acidobacteriota bacterium]
LELQLKLLEDVWRDVRRVPDASVLGAIQQTRAFQAGKTIPGWQMLVAMPKADEATRRAAGLHHADVQQIIDTLPQRNGQNLIDTAYFLMEYAELDAGQQEFVRPLVASEFIHMDPMAQGMLLQTRWQAVRTPTLVPALRAMLDKPPAQFVGYGDPLERLIELDPEAAAPYVQREICDPRSHVQMKQMAAIPAKTLPATDGCLLQQVTAHAADPRGAPGVAPWPEKTLVLARFASDAIYPSVLTLYQTHPGWDSYVRGAVIAYLIRWHPETVTALLPASSTTNTAGIMFSFNNVMEARHASYPEALRAELREQFTSGTDREAQNALYLLSRFGGQEDAAAALARLDRVMKEWQGRQSEWTMPANGTPAQAASMLQQQLVFALWSKEGRWQLPEPERQRVKSLCFGSVCSQSRWDGEGWKKSQ